MGFGFGDGSGPLLFDDGCFGFEGTHAVGRVRQAAGVEFDQAPSSCRLGRVLVDEEGGQILTVGPGLPGEGGHGQVGRELPEPDDLQCDLGAALLGRDDLLFGGRHGLFGVGQSRLLEIDEGVDVVERGDDVVETGGCGVHLEGLRRSRGLHLFSLGLQLLEALLVLFGHGWNAPSHDERDGRCSQRERARGPAQK